MAKQKEGETWTADTIVKKSDPPPMKEEPKVTKEMKEQLAFKGNHKETKMSTKSELELLREENAALKAAADRPITMKVADKGGLSLYGLGRFPVTLYKEQWMKVLDMSDDIRAFIKANDKQLKTKGD